MFKDEFITHRGGKKRECYRRGEKKEEGQSRRENITREQSYLSRLPSPSIPLSAERVCSTPPAFVVGEGQTRRAERGMGVNILKDERNRIFYLF
jgi:hypothetical protein